jgi:2-polyprenyl-3-methyl-5-hydroxy-6-metoxy-1,4-benzoquinol methylase
MSNDLLKLIEKYSAVDNTYGTDKTTTHCYGDVYTSLLEPLKEEHVKVLEIGIYSGAFLQVLSEYMPNAQLYGIDITLSRVTFGKDHPRIQMFEMDGTKKETAMLLNTVFDIIIEDGSHLPMHQIETLDVFAPYLNIGGVYIIEDIDGQYENTLRPSLQQIADKYGLTMEWMDLRHVKGRFDDIVAVFKRL